MDNLIDFILSHISWVIYIVATMAIVGAGVGFVQYNNYENTADQVISRSGGLTKSAYNILTKESESKYHNMFAVRVNKNQKYLSKPVAYGDYTSYESVIRIPVWKLEVHGSGKRTVQNDVRVD